MAHPPIANASAASPSQLENHRVLVGRRPENKDVINALTPMSVPPQPGTAVNEPARSIVSRMYLRFSKARSLMETTLAGFMRTHVRLRTVPVSSTLRCKETMPGVFFCRRGRDYSMSPDLIHALTISGA